MKKVVNACLGSSSFSIDEDAYARLEEYLGHFRSKLTEGPSAIPATQVKEVMDDLEGRISELFAQETAAGRVVNLALVDRVTAQLGMPDGSSEPGRGVSSDYGYSSTSQTKVPKKMYRDKFGDGKIAGICSGLAIYFDIDVVIIRVIMLVLLFTAGGGLLLYLILWIAVPKAETPAQMCEMRGVPPTAENLKIFADILGK